MAKLRIHAPDYYAHRESDPRIAAAFRDPLPESLRIAGTPTFSSLMEHPPVASFLSTLGFEPDADRSLSAIEGVTVAIALTFKDPSGRTIARVSWSPGSGVSFERLRAPD